MTNLVHGYVPDGWKRGDPLYFQAGPKGGTHSVVRDLLLLGPRGMPPPNEVGCVLFWDDDVPRVQEWLKWWRVGIGAEQLRAEAEFPAQLLAALLEIKTATPPTP